MENDQNLHPFQDVSEQIRKRRYHLATKRGYLALLKNMLIMAILICIIFTQVFIIRIAKGTDMFPAILDGDILLGYRLDKNYIKNDVVICEVDGKQIVGRVVAREGDSVNITPEGVLYVNGTVQTGEITFATPPKDNLTYPYIVPQGCVFLLGDFRTKTVDSRDYGPVSVDSIYAKVVSVLRKRGI